MKAAFDSLSGALLGIVVALVPVTATAAWPEKPLKIVVPSSPGGSADAVARLIGPRMAAALSQSVVIENKGGGGGNIATEAVAKSPADGYTILLTGNNHPLNVYLFSRPPYQLGDFSPIIELTRGPSVFVTAAGSSIGSLRDLIAKASAAPGSISYGSPGIGLPSHVAFELFLRDAKLSMTHVPYKGSGPSLTDAIGGQVPVVASTLAAALPHIQSGKLTALAVTSATRWASLPDTPTVAETLGRPFVHLTWLALLVPKGTPAAVIEQLNREADRALADPALRHTIEAMGTHVVGGSAASLQRVIDEEAAASKSLVESAHLRAD